MKDAYNTPSFLSSVLPLIGISITTLCFCLSLVSIFLPIKVYPLVFLFSAGVFTLDYWLSHRSSIVHNFVKPNFFQTPWVIFLLIFMGYALVSFIDTYTGNRFIISNILKLVINIIFLYSTVWWLHHRNNNQLLKTTDKVLFFLLLICLLQLLIYHQGQHFKLLTGASSSNAASLLYRPSLFFWGLNDKNMFGARLALLGFIFILFPLVRAQRIDWWRILFVFGIAYLSLSRTPIVALLLGIFFLIWIVAKKPLRIGLLAFIAITLPFIAKKLIRIEHIFASNDGMGVRLNYWRTFFSHFDQISPLGNGFLKGGDFLAQNAPFYHGEPHIHNTFLSCYLELGVIGFVSYLLFLIYFYRFCLKKCPSHLFWIAAFLPLVSIMMILYSGYDNDIVIYLILIFLLGSVGRISLNTIKMHV